MEIVNPRIESYLTDLLHEPDPLHSELENFAARKNFRTGNTSIPFPIVGPLVGKAIYQLACLIHARRILELGSGFGYSAYWFSRALGNQGELFLTDGSKENLEDAERFLGKISDRPAIHFQCGNALKILDEIPGEFDIIFSDIDKHQYPEVFKKAVPRIKKGGLLIADNVLWSGAVVDPKNPDKNTQGIIEFNRLISSSDEIIPMILPVRDGVAVCLKK